MPHKELVKIAHPPIIRRLHLSSRGNSKLRGQDAKRLFQGNIQWITRKEQQSVTSMTKPLRRTPELEAASEAAHKMKDSVSDEDDYQEFYRIVELGYLVEAVSGLCGPHLHLLTDIADAL